MKKKPQNQPKQNKVERPLVKETATSAAESLPEFAALPDHASARTLRQTAVLQTQQLHGNQYAQRLIARRQQDGRDGLLQRHPEGLR
ncbi:MAG: hypothetical protein HC804_07695 [Anaerolineae bacterium]|nr:hypothetical protein [Anaerolineae bacterium]